MQLFLVRTLWGLEDNPGNQASVLRQIASSPIQYDAVACPVQPIPDPDAFAGALGDAGLGLVAQVFSFGNAVEDHIKMARAGAERAVSLGAKYVVGQLGRDGWPLETSIPFLLEVARVADDLGVTILHETHRSRIFFNPWTCERVLEELPDLMLAADLSHWTCVSESMNLPQRILDQVAGATRHVDCRVGFEEGPQVPDPRVPRYASHLATFEKWWKAIWEAQVERGTEWLGMAPEFGPPPYQPVDPTTGAPLADVNELNDWMASRLVSAYRAG